MSIESRSSGYGSLFGEWHITKLLGSGSNGKSAVFQMSRQSNGWTEYSALKVISLTESRGVAAQLSADRASQIFTTIEKRKADAEHEVRTMAQFRGKTNIVDYLDHQFFSWQEDNRFGVDLLIRMELLEDLREEMDEKHHFSEEKIANIGLDICQALIICHKKNVLHRDIKPENIFFNKDGDYKLGDFGVAKILSSSPNALTGTGVGTPAYSAPEQFRGMYDKRVDIYSLGLVLYELANDNCYPFSPAGYISEEANTRRLKGEAFPNPRNVSEDFTKIILKACAFEPENRYASAEDFYNALSQFKAKILNLTNDVNRTIPAFGQKDMNQTVPAFVDVSSTLQAKPNRNVQIPERATQQKYSSEQTAYARKNDSSYENTSNNKSWQHKKMWIPAAASAVLMMCLAAGILLWPKTAKEEPAPQGTAFPVQTHPATEATAVVTLPETAPTQAPTEPPTEPPTEATRPQFPGPSYFMLEDDSLKDVSRSEWPNTYFWNQEHFLRKDIKQILFVNANPVLSPSAYSWDISALKNNTVRAYVDMETLYVVSDGRIAFPKNSAYLLAGFCNAKEISFENPVDTSNVASMERLFSDCNAVRELDLYSFDTSQVRNMGHMFAKCRSLTELDLRTFNTGKVTDMECMFYECKNLRELNLSSFDTSSVDTMKQMFQSCENISVLDISSFDVSRVKYMTYMFSECGNLRSVELGKFNTSSLRDINSMFYNCHSLQEIDTSGWNLSGLTNCTKTFEKCTSLKNIKADNWNFPKNVRPIDFMEDGCTINGIPWKDYFKQLS